VPVIVQNAEQVNIATDGGQQMNLQQKSNKRGKKASDGNDTCKQRGKRATKSKPKQLSAQSIGETINLEPVSDVTLIEASEIEPSAPNLRR
jgi:hypothetical protein